MQTPARILRAQACDIDPALNDLTTREIAQRDYILKLGQALMARNGPHAMSFTSFAHAMKMAPTTLRKHYCDLDALLAAILRRHLKAIATALGALPRDTPDLPKARRQVFLEATSSGFAALSPAHHLFARYYHTLPADEREPIETTWFGLAELLAPGHGHRALALLDASLFSPAQVETMLAALAAPSAAAPPPEIQPKPEPEPEPQAQPQPQPQPITLRPATFLMPPGENRLCPRHPDDVYILPLADSAAAPP